MHVNARIARLAKSDRRRESRCVEAACDRLATHISSDQEFSNGVLMAPAERLLCAHHAEQFAAERRIPMPS